MYKRQLISHLNALTRIQSGVIFVDDIDLRPKKLDFKKLRSKVGTVSYTHLDVYKRQADNVSVRKLMHTSAVREILPADNEAVRFIS